MSTFRHIIGSVYKYIKMFLSKLRHDAVSAYAANAAFFILVSIFPFLILTVTVINAVLPESYFTIAELMQGIPQFLSDFLSKTLSEAENAVNWYCTFRRRNLNFMGGIKRSVCTYVRTEYNS